MTVVVESLYVVLLMWGGGGEEVLGVVWLRWAGMWVYETGRPLRVGADPEVDFTMEDS
jgi:hypothetical protein